MNIRRKKPNSFSMLVNVFFPLYVYLQLDTVGGTTSKFI